MQEQAYRETEFVVHARPTFVLRVGEYSKALERLHAAGGVSCSAFITAWNPYSRQLDVATNRWRQGQLFEELTRSGYRCIAGHGQHPGNDWPGEDSVLVLGLDQASATAVGQHWEQNAIVWCGADAVPQLLML